MVIFGGVVARSRRVVMSLVAGVYGARAIPRRVDRPWRRSPSIPTRPAFLRPPRSVSSRWVQWDFPDDAPAKSKGKGGKKDGAKDVEKQGKTKKQKRLEAEALGLTMDELDPAKSAEEAAAAEAAEKAAAEKERRRKMSRASLLVGALFLSWLFAVAAVADPTFFKRAVAICLSLATRLANGTRSNDYALEAAVCVGAIGLLRVALKPLARLIFRWWTGSTSDKSWSSSFLCWLILNVYGPLELALVAVAGVRFFEAGVELAGVAAPSWFAAVVEKTVQGALVLAGARVFLSWQERLYTRKTFDLEVEGKTLQAERLAGLNKLSNMATYVVTAVAGLKVLGVDIGALVTFGGISGLAIGLAGRQILENAFMGLMLYATAPFMPGDEIKFSTSQEKNINGFVVDIGLFRTTIRSLYREMYYIPNSLFSSLAVLNITRRGKEFRFKHEIIVRLEDAPRVSNAIANFRSVIKSDPRVLRNMHRRVFLDSISKEGLHLVISFYIEAVNKDQFYAIQQEMLQAFLETCRKNSVRVSPNIRAVMQIESEDELDGPMMSPEVEAALARAEESEKEKIKEKEGGLAAALTALTGGGGSKEK